MYAYFHTHHLNIVPAPDLVLGGRALQVYCGRGTLRMTLRMTQKTTRRAKGNLYGPTISIHQQGCRRQRGFA